LKPPALPVDSVAVGPSTGRAGGFDSIGYLNINSLDGASADGSMEGCGVTGACRSSMNRRNDNEPYSFHAASGNFLFADAHVRFITESIALPTLAALCTMNAEEVIGIVEN
jgi:prepilin-type processing-associated H-X9-DG protein